MSEISDRTRFARDHRWAPGQMSAYVDGELAPDARARLERHLGVCVECRRVLASLRRLIDRLGDLGAPGGAPDAREVAAAVRVGVGHPRRPD